MEKLELLSPAGNKESLYMAVHAGADAIYISGKKYGARKYAENFSDDEIKEAINYCHLYNVKVYVTLNTLIFESEIEGFLEYAKMLYLNNVDAVIVQDIGMIKLLRTTIPELEIHTSTQTHNYNVNTTKMFKELGVKRVVLARELTLDEIEEHSKILETEVFVHGALCMSYSGCCYMSLLRGGRSGNRGECAGTCRLPYKTSSNDKYVLSTRDLCNIYDLDKIIKTGTKSLKIEGRMKSKEYVYLVTRLYRKTIDKYYETGIIEVDCDLYNDIKKVFNREYTKGHKFLSNDIMNPLRPNHQGILIGQVTKVNQKYITIKLNSDILVGDGIKFTDTDTGFTISEIYLDGKKVNSAYKNQIISVRNTVHLKRPTPVVKTTDKALINSLKTIEHKSIKIDCNVKINESEIEVEYIDNNNIVSKKSKIVQKAKNINTTKQDIIKQLSKLGNTPFEMNNINVLTVDNIFINIKDLNELRRSLINELIDKKTNYKRNIQNIKYDNNLIMNNKDIEINASIINEDQYNVLKKLNINNIYTSNYDLYKKHIGENIYYILPRIIDNDNLDIDKLVVNDYNYLPKNKDIIGNYYLNITNSISCKYACEKGIKKICVSPDLNIDRLNEILQVNNNINFEIQVYGYYEVMITKNNISQKETISSNNYNYNIVRNKNYTSILNSPVNNIKMINKYYKIGVKKYRLDFYNESANDIYRIILEVQKEIKEILRF